MNQTLQELHLVPSRSEREAQHARDREATAPKDTMDHWNQMRANAIPGPFLTAAHLADCHSRDNPKGRLFCRNCDGYRAAFQARQLACRYMYRPVPSLACAECGWYYYRRAINKALRASIYKQDGYECVYCGSSDWIGLDHIRPLVHGGDDSRDNLVTACQSCNTRRRDALEHPVMRFGRFRY